MWFLTKLLHKDFQQTTTLTKLNQTSNDDFISRAMVVPCWTRRKVAFLQNNSHSRNLIISVDRPNSDRNAWRWLITWKFNQSRVFHFMVENQALTIASDRIQHYLTHYDLVLVQLIQYIQNLIHSSFQMNFTKKLLGYGHWQQSIGKNG